MPVSKKKKKKKLNNILQWINPPLPPFLSSAPAKCEAQPTLAGIHVEHYQLFKFSLASEAVLPDNHIVPATPLPTFCIGTGYGNSVCPPVWTGP